ncbi:MAG: xanthine dehydrogenase family protein molybdopterin-binding subunit [Proteobacteria bacterium]|nr:xanthine dehydrogenase family protein molybdopterin-binding subunit [Pseudomonadota bacterium]MBI3496382.1 xanthine dehydrogenase family protein molybdopterin-binding subunit [Pseudomonadota bacterium]
MAPFDAPGLSRRSLIQGAGLLVVSVALPLPHGRSAALAAASGKPPLTPDQLDSWLAIADDGMVTAFFGKMDMGHGLDVAISQMVAEELDVAPDRVTVVMGDTATSVNQGGASGSTGVQNGGRQLRYAAAEARRVLVGLAAERLGVPAESLSVTDGTVHPSGDPAGGLSYAALLAGKSFEVKLEWNGKIGNDLLAIGKAKPKAPQQYRVVGKPLPRRDVAAKVYAQLDYVTDVKVDGMLHGRMIRPAVAGAVPIKVDAASIADIPGVRIVHLKDFLGVVAPKEWDAIRASERLKVTWSEARPPFPRFEELYQHIRRAQVTRREQAGDPAAVAAAFARAARVVEAEYEWPFQSHASMGPACAIVDAGTDQATLWTGSQKPHFARDGVARILGLPPEKVRGIWVPGPGSYGRNDAGDAALDAAVLSKAVGRPVRLQGMRHEGHGWDPKAPASIHRVRAGLDRDNAVIAYEFISKGFSRLDIDSNESNPGHSLAGQLMGLPLTSIQAFGMPAESYGFANKLMAWETIPPLLERASPLRTSHLRDPLGPQLHFASESFIDEIAAAIGQDPLRFRLAHVKDARDVAVIKAAAERSGWDERPSPKRAGARGEVATGRGIGYAQRGGTIVAVVAEVEVERKSGRVWARKFTVAHDCGQIINPEGLRQCIEGNVVQAISRSLYEEVIFDERSVTSGDWLAYPILDIVDTPERIDVALIDRPELPPAGAGEPATRPVTAAIANAIFDATGVRLRRAPFTPERVRQALS